MSKVRPALRQILDICLILSSTYMLWETLRMITNSPSPIVVVISESMEPAFSRGDLLFLWNRDENVEVWDIAVCWFEGRDLPMVHRVVKRFPLPVTAEPRNRTASSRSPAYQLLTKGDNNDDDDTTLYPPAQLFLDRNDVVGTLRGYIPFLGYITIALSEYPWAKQAMLVSLGLVIFLQRA